MTIRWMKPVLVEDAPKTEQRAAVRGAVDRAERITPSSDAAVGKAIG